MDYLADGAGALQKFTTCLGAAGLSIAIRAGLSQDMLLWRYALWLELLRIRWRRRGDRIKRAALKPLGQCIYCYSVWVHITIYATYIGWGDLPIYAGINFIIIKAWVHYVRD